MFLDYWMIAVLFIFLFLALATVYFSGYDDGFKLGSSMGFMVAIHRLRSKLEEGGTDSYMSALEDPASILKESAESLKK